MRDNTQELDGILARHNGELGVTWEDPDAVTPDTKQAILDWHNKQILESLDRLLVEVKQAYDKEGDFLEMAVDTIEAERNKLEAEL